jgi:hypothetical protein
MTSPQVHHWSTQGLRRLAVNMVPQEHVGVLGSLLLRLARYLGGDPTVQIALSVPFNTPTPLPDNVPAQSATFQVTVSPITYRMDGGNPTIADALLPIGAYVTLTGQPSIKGFRAISISLTSAVLAGSFYD